MGYKEDSCVRMKLRNGRISFDAETVSRIGLLVYTRSRELPNIYIYIYLYGVNPETKKKRVSWKRYIKLLVEAQVKHRRDNAIFVPFVTEPIYPKNLLFYC